MIGVDTATAITTRLHDVATRTGFTDDLAIAETTLVTVASQTAGGLGYTADEVDAVALRLREHLDPDGAEPRETALHDNRAVTVHTLPSGMTRLNALLPPSMAAVVCAALEPFTSPRIVSFITSSDPAAANPSLTDSAVADPVTGWAVTDPAACPAGAPDPAGGTDPSASPAAGEPSADPVFADTRTLAQKRADALVQVIGMAAGLPGVPRVNGAAPTVNVHATLEDVVSGRGVGWVDGLTAPVPASTVDTLLCYSDVITTLFGNEGQVLQHGKTRRLFTPAQNRALAARDGGCVWPGCDAPPSWCESHHVEGWQSTEHLAGRTDIDNGALLCHFHHSNIHKTPWKLVICHGTPHLIPPGYIDWTQTPRPCPPNRARQHPPPGQHAA